MTGADVAGVLELRRRVRWGAGPEAFEILLEGVPSARWALAEAPSGSPVGMVGGVPLGEIGILCHLAVHPAHRGRGLGTQLSRWAITYLRSQGVGAVRLESTPVAEKLYESLGFRKVGRRVLYHREAKPGVRPVIYGKYRVAPLKASDLPEVYGLDRLSFGGDRSALIEALLRRQGGSGLVARDATRRVAGYLFRSGERLGPWAASTPEAGQTLMVRALTAAKPGIVEVAAPGGGPAHEVLVGLGFTGIPDRLRMELGEGPKTGGLETYGLSSYLVT